MSRIFCIPGVFFLFAALVLSFLSSISLPYLPALDIVRTQFGTEVLDSGAQGLTELRLGVWAYCYYDQDLARTCIAATHAYTVGISNAAKTVSVVIGSSWTRGLAVHPVATGVTFIAFLLSLSMHRAVALVASLFAFLAAALSLIAFAIDIAVFVFLRHEVTNLPNVDSKTTIGAGFWLTFVSFLLLLIGGVTVCLGRRQRLKRTDDATTYPVTTPNTSEKKPFWTRFRKN